MHDDPDQLHRALAGFNAARVRVSEPGAHWEQQVREDMEFRLHEGRFIEQLRRDVASWLPSASLDTQGFVRWFETLDQDGPGQGHALFPWLAEEATLDQMSWFLAQEAAGEAGFEDLLAMTQVKLPVRAKLECARNYWDEMGHGKQSAMHAQMLDTMVADLALQPAPESTVWEALALANTMLALACNRRYGWQSLGALGAIELTAPGRVAQVSAGMKRLGIGARARAYFDLHAALDKAHSRAWIAEIIGPAVEEVPQRAVHIAEGALMRLVCGRRCFDRYQAELRQIERVA